jgi:hypothetical protein
MLDPNVPRVSGDVFFYSPDDRWIRKRDVLGTGAHSYSEVSPVVVARACLDAGIPLWPELEPFRETATGDAFFHWMNEQGKPGRRVLPPKTTTKEKSPVPAVEELAELVEAYMRFNNQNSYSAKGTWVQEDNFLPFFSRLADAMRPIRTKIDSIEGWPPDIGHAIGVLLEHFDAITTEWGWERVAAPEPERSLYVNERCNWFRQTLARPMYEAALSMQVRDGLRCRAGGDANEGWALGFSATMTPEEGDTLYDDARKRWMETPRFGSRYPKVENENELATFAFNALSSRFVGLEANRERPGG